MLWTSIVIVWMVGQAGDPAVVEAMSRLGDKDANVRLKAISVMANSKVELAPRAIAALANLADDEDPRVRKLVVQTLGEIGPRSREWGGGPRLSNLLVKRFQDKDLPTRKAAVWAFGQVGIDTVDELEPVYLMFQDPSAEIRRLAYAAAGQYVHDQTPPASRQMIVERIAEGLGDKDDNVKRASGLALQAAGADAVPTLIRRVETTKGPPRLWAAIVLGEIGPPAHDSLPALEQALREVPPDGRPFVLQAIKKIAPP